MPFDRAEWEAKNPDKIKAYRKSFYAAHKDEQKEKHRKWVEKNRDRVREYDRRWRAANPDKTKATWKRAYEKDPVRMNQTANRSRMKKWYGVTPEWVAEQRERQGDKCATCRNEFVKTPHIDHNHETGKARELLCARCNVAIGYLEHELLPNWLDYLAKHDPRCWNTDGDGEELV